MAYTIAFFGTKPYDESSFNDKNKEFGFEIRYYKGHLNKNNVLLTQRSGCCLHLCERRCRRRSNPCDGSQRSKTIGTTLCRI